MTNYITCSKDMSEVPETACINNCDVCALYQNLKPDYSDINEPDWEELMLQISDVMREANRVRPDMTHEQAVRKIKEIVRNVE